MLDVTWLPREELFSHVKTKIDPVHVVLDIGCGIRPQEFTSPLVHICYEPSRQYLEKLHEIATKRDDRAFVLVNANLEQIEDLIPPQSVDTIFLLDVIEHLEKEVGQRLLPVLDKIARRQIVVFTPLGFLPQTHPDGKDAWGLDGGHLQEHRSGWLPEDFDESWKIYASKEFHLTDNFERKFEQPYGAFIALKTKNPEYGHQAEVPEFLKKHIRPLEQSLQEQKRQIDQLRSFVDSLEHELALGKQLTEATKFELGSRNAEAASLRHELSEIYGSRTWKYGSRIRDALRRLRIV